MEKGADSNLVNAMFGYASFAYAVENSMVDSQIMYPFGVYIFEKTMFTTPKEKYNFLQ